MEISGRVCLITGAARRLGREMALGLAGRGAKLAVHFRDSEVEAAELIEQLRAKGAEALPFRADLRVATSCTRLVEDVATRFGRIDVLINSASDFYRTPLEAVSEDQWDDLLSINLKAPFFCSQAAGPRMKRQGEGKIINIADVAALRPWKGYIPFSVAKAGLLALTRGLAVALAPEVQVNAIAPGTILPPEGTAPEEVEKWKARIPLNRIGTPADLVRTVLFLLEAGDYITGEAILLDGGRHLT